jgi:hypothetical protein
MEPRATPEPHDLTGLRLDVLRAAVDIYLGVAYPGAEPPAVVRRRLDWEPGLDAGMILSRPPFERVGPQNGAEATIFALRLGNLRYPHMKLQVQPWPNGAGFLLSVNTHDQVLSLDPNTSDLPAFRELQAENQRVKESVEQAWDEAGLPTFLRYLREYIEGRKSETARPDGAPPGGA